MCPVVDCLWSLQKFATNPEGLIPAKNSYLIDGHTADSIAVLGGRISEDGNDEGRRCSTFSLWKIISRTITLSGPSTASSI